MSDFNNPTAHWKFNASSGNENDEIGSFTLTSNNSPGSTAGKIGNARTFNGINQSFSRTSESALQTGTTFSLAGWVFLNTTMVVQTIAARWDSDGEGVKEYRLNIPSAGTVRFTLGNLSSVDSSITASGWRFVAVFYDSSEGILGISVNGANFTTASTGAFSAETLDTCFGRDSAGLLTFPLNGNLDSWTFWKGYRLTQSDVTTLYNSGNGLDYPFTGGQAAAIATSRSGMKGMSGLSAIF